MSVNTVWKSLADPPIKSPAFLPSKFRLFFSHDISVHERKRKSPSPPSCPRKSVTVTTSVIERYPRYSVTVSSMSNIPSQPPRAAPSSASSTADSWHTVASDYSQDPTPSVGSPAEEVITLNPGRQRTTSQGSGATERRKCWVCLTEEGETAPDGTLVNSSRWSKACACSLDAHESCLITWINQTRGPDPNQVVHLNAMKVS